VIEHRLAKVVTHGRQIGEPGEERETADRVVIGNSVGTSIPTGKFIGCIGCARTRPMRDVVDPELGINVVDLGLIYDVVVEPDPTSATAPVVTLDMTLTSAACPLTDVIEDQTNSALSGLVKETKINWVWMPPWGPDKITDEGREQLRALGFNV
jgi:metal-sulfur cluster biosynthetic enzyme